jgi:hypothetical protein
MAFFRRVGVCPYCRSGLAVTSRLRGLEWGLWLLPFRPRRCLECRQRFWLPRWLVRLLGNAGPVALPSPAPVAGSR